MDLFEQFDPQRQLTEKQDVQGNLLVNHLPQDGEVYYYGPIMSLADANRYFDALLHEIAWQQDQAMIFGKLIQTQRKVAWHADHPYDYTYSKRTKTALPWTTHLLALKALVEQRCQQQFNACLLNLYHSGEEGMAWHSDAERDLKKYAAIASLSLGAERKFSFKHKSSGQKVDLRLAHGSLLIMQGQTQSHWLHRLAPSKAVKNARINLTFRVMAETQTAR